MLRTLLFALLVLKIFPASAEDYGEPLKVSMTVVPATAKAGDVVELQLTLLVNSPWHAFADTPGSVGQRALKLDTQLPQGLEALGDWQWPKFERIFEGYEVHIYKAGEHVFKRKVKVTSVTGTVTIRTKVTYQCCNPEFCGPVQTVDVSAELNAGATESDNKSPIGRVATEAKPAMGATMPAVGSTVSGTPLDMKFIALDGRKVDVSELQGNVVLIDFWATWCVPCVAELPNVKAMYEKYRKQGLEVIGVSFDEATAQKNLMEFVKKRQLGWPMRFDGNNFDQAAQQLYGIRGIPATFLIDREGQLVAANIKGDALEPALRKCLGLTK